MGKKQKQSLQEAFDAGFDAVKDYIERSFDAYDERLIEIEKQAGARISALEERAAALDLQIREVAITAPKPAKRAKASAQ